MIGSYGVVLTAAEWELVKLALSDVGGNGNTIWPEIRVIEAGEVIEKIRERDRRCPGETCLMLVSRVTWCSP